jgi:putative acetyltransferase
MPEAGEEMMSVSSATIRPEATTDLDAIRHVNRLAFGQDDEANLVDALRDGGFVKLSLVAEFGEQVIGHILFSGIRIVSDTGSVDALALAPMAVIPEHQRRRIGSALVRSGLEQCRQAGHRIVIVVGHPNFYPRFGFSPELASRLESEYAGEAFMALELVPGAMEGVEGVVKYSPPFGAL